LLIAAVLLAGCPRPVRSPVPEGSPSPAAKTAPATVPRGTTIYAISPQDSTVRVLVYRSGALARLGHNHVMTVRALQGKLWSHPDITQSGFEMSFPIAEMIVDDPEERSAAGSDFPPDIAQADRDGTRRNMLRAEVLDAEHYPRIELKSVRITGSREKPQVTVRITIKGVSREIALTPAVKLEGSQLTVAGEFDILQSDFGIKPFTAALGALAVQDRLHMTFNLVARK